MASDPGTSAAVDRRVLPAGPTAWLVECDDPIGLTAAVAEAPVPLLDVVPGARTVLVTVVDHRDLRAAREWLADVTARPSSAETSSTVEIPVTYDGEDLADVAAATGRSVEEVVARHTAGDYVSAFCGFAPGFAYLRGLDPVLVLPRRSTPRTRVPAGSVAIADDHTAVYPSVSPGGWHLLGRTTMTLWDLQRVPPAVLTPGTRVRFVAVP